jgi:hypothetical protein
MLMVGQTCPFRVLDEAKGAGELLEVVDDEQVAAHGPGRTA